jgi:hypothetical protein
LIITVSIGAITGSIVAIVEGMLALWRSLSKSSETKDRRAIIRALSSTPKGIDTHGIKLLLKENGKGAIPDQIVENYLDDLVLARVVKVYLSVNQTIMYSLVLYQSPVKS